MEKVTMTPVETPSKKKPSKMRWFSATKAYLQIPNPAIVKVFVLSSLTTFTSGFALALEWIVHGKSHSGFGWIIYYALFLMCLPLFLIGLYIFKAISSSHDSNNAQLVDSTSSKEPCVVKDQSTEETNQRAEETERNSCQSLAVVVASDEKKIPRIKRAVSYPSHGEVRSCRTR